MRGDSGLDAKEGMSRTAAISRQSMRAFVAVLERAGQLTSIKQPVSVDFEISACLVEADSGPALRFDAVHGHKLPIVGNLLNSLERIAIGLGTTPVALQSVIIAAIDQPLGHSVLALAPWQGEIIPDPVLA